MSKNMNKRATKRKSASENSILKFPTVSSMSSDSIVKEIIDENGRSRRAKERKENMKKLSVSYIK